MRIEVSSIRSSFLILFLIPVFILSGCTSSDKEITIEPWEYQAANARPLTDVSYEVTPERIERGEYLVNSMWCMQCHSPMDKTQPGQPPKEDSLGAGAYLAGTDSTWVYAPNLTPDPETGMGNFTDDMIARAIREGVGHDGRGLMYMPWRSFRTFTDEDVAAMVVYLKSMDPIVNELPDRQMSEAAEQRSQQSPEPLYEQVADPDFTDPVERGKYLIQTGDCAGCHTGWYARNPGIYGGGNPIAPDEGVFSSNITSDPTGIGAWTKETFIQVIRTGKNGTLHYRMPWTTYRNLSDEDLGAIYEALKTTQPVKHIVMNRTPLSYCPVCEMEHGGGSLNELEDPGYIEDFDFPADLAGSYVFSDNPEDTASIFYENDIPYLRFLLDPPDTPPFELKALAEDTFTFEGFHVPFVVMRDEDGEINRLALKDLSFEYLEKVE